METVSNIVVGRTSYTLVSGSTEARCPDGQHHNFWSTNEPEAWEIAANAVDEYLKEVLHGKSTNK